MERINILVAEDDPNIALALKILLRQVSSAIVVMMVRDGQEALAALQERPWNLLVSDWNMPGMTGLELLTRVRATPETAQLPFLMLTGRADAEAAMESFAGMTTDHIGKPFDNQVFLQTVSRLLQQSNVVGDLPGAD